MKKLTKRFSSAPFQWVLVISFSLVAATTIAIGAWVISKTIGDYLSESMAERVDRDMSLAEAFYDINLKEIEGISQRLALDPLIAANLDPAKAGDGLAQSVINRQIANKLSVLSLGGNHFIGLFDLEGNIVSSQITPGNLPPSPFQTGGKWFELPILQTCLQKKKVIAATEVIPASILVEIGLQNQASIQIIDTPKAAPMPFDPREGSAGLALVGAAPILNDKGTPIGLAVAMHLFNNDFTLVDKIKDVAGIDTVTIFFGDLRVSTNVKTSEGERAIGTRVSQEVSDIVLAQNREFVGPAFVVNENYITRYDPIHDHTGKVVGMLYVGVRQASFYKLVNTVTQRILLVALGTIILTILLTTPVSQAITRPLNELKELVEANRLVAQGDMSVRVPVRTGGEVGTLAKSYNSMLDTLQATQDQLVQSEKLISLGQLAAGVAHELNNPLGTILLYSDILLKESSPDSVLKEDLQVIVKETQRCKNIVGSLLDFARQNQVVAQTLDLNELIRNVFELEQKRGLHNNISPSLELDPTLPKIQADPAQIQQVLINLISNGIEAMPDGGKLSIRTLAGPPGMVTLEVEDSGEGIAPENLSKLFTPFFTTKPIGIGTGLGLAIIYGIIKMHRGQINVQSKLGQGTRFIINLPIKLSSSANMPSQAKS